MKRSEKQVGIWIIPKRHCSILLTRLSKKGILTWLKKKGKPKPNVVKEFITPTNSAKKDIDTVNKTEKAQASNKTVDTPKGKKIDKR